MADMSQDAIIAKLKKDIRRLRAPAGYIRAGLPNFPGLFGRDSLIISWQLLDLDPGIARATLKKLASMQGEKVHAQSEEEPGKILHEYYEPWQLRTRFLHKPVITFFWGTPYYGSIDATFLWIIVFARYCAKTKDRALARTLTPSLLRALSWVRDYADHNRDGFFDYQSHNPAALRHQAWKDSDEFGDLVPPIAPIEVQGYAYGALQEAALLLKDTHPDMALWAEERAGTLKQKFSAAYRASDYFAFAKDGQGEKIAWVTSNPSHLLFTGILEREEEEMIMEKVFSEELWTPFGMRTLAVSDPHFNWQSYHRGSVWPHDNWFLWMGLRSRGRFSEAERVKHALRAAYEELGGRMPELYAVRPGDNHITTDIFIGHSSEKQRVGDPQGWAAGAFLSMLSS